VQSALKEVGSRLDDLESAPAAGGGAGVASSKAIRTADFKDMEAHLLERLEEQVWVRKAQQAHILGRIHAQENVLAMLMTWRHLLDRLEEQVRRARTRTHTYARARTHTHTHTNTHKHTHTYTHTQARSNEQLSHVVEIIVADANKLASLHGVHTAASQASKVCVCMCFVILSVNAQSQVQAAKLVDRVMTSGSWAMHCL